MPAKIDPCEPDQPCTDVERYTEFGIPISEERRTGESVGGVTRWERRITGIVQGALTSDDFLHPPNDYTCADESGSQQPACVTVRIAAVSHQEQRNPQHGPPIAEVGAQFHGGTERLGSGRFVVDRIEYILIQFQKKIAFFGVPRDGGEAEKQYPQRGSEGSFLGHRW